MTTQSDLTRARMIDIDVERAQQQAVRDAAARLVGEPDPRPSVARLTVGLTSRRDEVQRDAQEIGTVASDIVADLRAMRSELAADPEAARARLADVRSQLAQLRARGESLTAAESTVADQLRDPAEVHKALVEKYHLTR